MGGTRRALGGGDESIILPCRLENEAFEKVTLLLWHEYCDCRNRTASQESKTSLHFVQEINWISLSFSPC